jgi:hypothetical protein
MTLLSHRSPVTLLIGVLAAALLTGCGLLDVDNPNNLQEDEIDPTAAPALANGAEAAVTRALGAIHAPYHTASGELIWVGSRDSWGQLDVGVLNNESNEFTDGAFPYVAEATWTTRTYIERLKTFRSNDNLSDDRLLVRTYLYGAIIYTSTADMFDNFVFSDRREAGQPVGEGNMTQLYDQAITWLDAALALVDGNSSLEGSDLEATLYAMRARAKYSKALWPKVNGESVNTAAPLVNSSGAVADAQEALDRMDEDFRYELEMIPSAPDLVVGGVSMADQINNRGELSFAGKYLERNEDDEIVGTAFTDLISGDPHPYLNSFILNFITQGAYADIPVVSQREMYLILAEAALAGNGSTGGSFADHINALRSLDELPPYEGTVDAQTLLRQSREVNLFLQGRRLADHYRFAAPSPQWTDARNAPGTFFPITITEIRANPNLSQD